MHKLLHHHLTLSTAIILVTCVLPDVHAEDVVGFDQVKPILRKRCVNCHNPDELRGELDLKELTALRAGSSSGDVVVAGDPSASLLFTTIAHLEDPVMPPNSQQIPAREQDIIRRWIEGGLAERTGPKSEPVENPKAMKANSTVASESAANSEPGLVAIRPLPQASAITALATHPSRDLAVLNGLQQAVLFRPSTGELLGAIDIAEGDVTALSFSGDGQLLLVAAGKAALLGTVIAFDADSGERVWQVADETDSILTFDLAPDGNTLAVGGPSKTVRLYEVPSGRELHALKKHTDWILSVRFSPDGLLLASSDRFGGIFVWEPSGGTVFQDLKDHVGPVHAIAWDRDAETLISGGADGKLRTWNLHHGELTSSWDAQVGEILDLTRGSASIAAAGRDGKVTLWAHADALSASYAFDEQAEVLAEDASGEHLIVGNTSGRATILSTNKLKPVVELQLPNDAEAMQRLLVRLDRAEQDYLSEMKASEQQRIDAEQRELALAAQTPSSANSSVPSAASNSGLENQPQFSDTDPTKVYSLLDSELAANRQHATELQDSLQQSHRMLSNMAQNNERLIELLRQSTEAQSQLAQQISQQAEMLESLRKRTQQLEQAIGQH